MPLTPKDIETYFADRNNHFTNSLGMIFGLHHEDGIWTSHTFVDINADSELDEDSLIISIHTGCDSEADFITLFNLEDVAGIDRLSYVHSWMRYLNSQAEIIVEVVVIEADLYFRIINQKTIIFSPELHFFDQVYQHLTLRDEIEGYIHKNMDLLYTASGYRYKY